MCFFWCELRSYILHRSWRHAIKDCQICMHTGSNWRLSRRCYNISHLTWQPYILLTASVHNFLTLYKLKLPLCNLTLEPTWVRTRVGAMRFLRPKRRWLTITGLQNHNRAVHNAAPNTGGASRAQLCRSPWFVRNQISGAPLSRSHQLPWTFFSKVSGWSDGFPRE